jgi:ubiquitin-conjugating enzyme E2 L3
MSGTRRLQKEFKDLQSSGIIETESVKNLEIDSQSILQWSGKLNPTKAPYDKGSFKFNINFPAEYPFKPPKVTLKTLIYHPNIDEKGQICLPIVAAENWKPATKVEHVLHALLDLIDNPECEHPLRTELAEIYMKDKKKFMKSAEEFTKKHSEPR